MQAMGTPVMAATVRDTAVVGTVIGWMLAYRAGLVSLLSVLCLLPTTLAGFVLGHLSEHQLIVLHFFVGICAYMGRDGP